MQLTTQHACVVCTKEDDEKYIELALKSIGIKKDKNLLEVRKNNRNGQIRLVYSTDGMDSYKNISESLPVDIHKRVLDSLSEVMNFAQKEPFIEYEFINLDPEYVFIDSMTHDVKFLALPIAGARDNNKKADWTNNLLTLLSLILSHVDAEEVKDLRIELQNCLAQEDAFTRLQKSGEIKELLCQRAEFKEEEPQETSSIGRIVLQYAGLYGKFSFIDEKESFVLGSESGCDGVLNISMAVSRKHCVINKNGAVTATDLGSTNGTFINGVRMVKDKPYALNEGDKLQLADIELSVHIE